MRKKQKQRKSPGLVEALEKAGGCGALAGQIHSPRDKRKKLTRQAVEAWTEVPHHHVLEVEKITGVTRYRLRPDLYGDGPIKPEPLTPRTQSG